MDYGKLQEQMVEWRHSLHQHPGTAFNETFASDLVARELSAMPGIEVTRGIGKTGVIGRLKVGNGTHVIGLRADMDALPMKETGNPAWKSEIEGCFHGCGHDGHTASLLGAARVLSETRDFNGTVIFLFQPAEEPGKGAQAMIDDGLLERFPMDEIYGYHNAPMLPKGFISTRPGGMNGAEDDFTIRIHGKGFHASHPNNGKDPLVAAAEIIMALQTVVSRSADPIEPAVISCTEFETDGSHNAVLSNVEIRGDTRSTTPAMSALIEERMRAIVKGICEMNDMTWDFIYTHEFAPTVNHEQNVAYAVKAAAEVVGADHVTANGKPSMGAEDFGKFLTYIPGCFVSIGSSRYEDTSRNYGLHNSQYDYNDEILSIAARFFVQLVRDRLPQ